jgi:hypothetical protein
LKDHRDFVAADRADLFVVDLQKIASLEQDLTPRDLAWGLRN